MGDRTSCTLKLFGQVPESVVAAIAESLGAGEVWPPRFPSEAADDLAEGCFRDFECYTSHFDDARAILEDRGLPYRFEQDGYTGSYPASVTLYTPDDGEHEFAFDGSHLCVALEGPEAKAGQAALAERMLTALAAAGPLAVTEEEDDDPDFAEVTPDHWADDPEFPARDWRVEVMTEDTRLGYREWVNAKRETA